MVLTAILAGSLFAAVSPAAADGPYPDPGFPVVPCSEAGDKVFLTSSAQLDPSCNYTEGVEITASDVTLDCMGALVVKTGNGAGIRVQTPADTDMSGVTVRNCVVSGFLNSIRVRRDGGRDLPAGEEYDHVLEDVTLTNNHLSGSSGVGIFVDAYVTGTTISDSTIDGAGGSGIYLEAGSADNVVTGNEIVDSGFGENGPSGQLETVSGLQFRFWGTGREGISVDGSRRNLIQGNTLEGNSAGGIYIYTNCGEYKSKPNHFVRRYGATDNVIAGNHLAGGVSGVWVGSRMGESVLPMDCSDTPYYQDGLAQITRDRASDNTVIGNDFEDFTYGVRVEDDNTKVIGNHFSGPDGSQYAVVTGTPYRTSVLGEPVSGTQLIGNQSVITGNPNPYRWVEGETGSIVSGNKALGTDVGMCKGRSLPRGPLVMVIAFASEPPGSPVTPAPDPLAIPEVGPQAPCSTTKPPDETPPDEDPPSNQFRFGNVVRNKKTGTATLVARIPGAGKLRLKGTRSIRGLVKTARRSGTVKLTLKARGKAAGRLRRQGRVKLKATVTFTPSGGTSRTRSRKVTLLKKTNHR